MTHDTLLDCLVVATEELRNPKSRSFLAVATGHWLRISLAMNIRTNDQIGHPYGELGWDYFALQQAFTNAGLESTLVVATERNNLAKQTAAHDAQIQANVVLAESFTEFVNLLTGGVVIIGQPSGEYAILSTTALRCPTVSSLSAELYEKLPLGYAAFVVHAVHDVPDELPWDTLHYLAWTFERGEEPTEVAGKGHYSTVSGWKAYARWMQAYMLDNPKALHQWIAQLPYVLRDRRASALPYWKTLAQVSQFDRAKELALLFVQQITNYLQTIDALIQKYEHDVSYSEKRKLVTQCYFADQQTLPIFKQIKKLHHDLQHQKLL